MRAPISTCSYDVLMAQVGLETKSHHSARRISVDGKIYSSIKSAALAIDCTSYGLYRAAKEGRKCKGHIVEYVSEGE